MFEDVFGHTADLDGHDGGLAEVAANRAGVGRQRRVGGCVDELTLSGARRPMAARRPWSAVEQPEVDEPEGRLGDIELDGPLQAVEADVQLTGCGRSFDLWLQN